MSLRLDEELSELERALLRSHLAGCEACARFAAGAGHMTAALRAARLERPVLVVSVPRGRHRGRHRAAHALQVGAAAALVAAVGAATALVGAGNHAGAAPSAKPVAVVAAVESPDAFRALRRPLLLAPTHELPRNRRVPIESA